MTASSGDGNRKIEPVNTRIVRMREGPRSRHFPPGRRSRHIPTLAAWLCPLRSYLPVNGACTPDYSSRSSLCVHQRSPSRARASCRILSANETATSIDTISIACTSKVRNMKAHERAGSWIQFPVAPGFRDLRICASSGPLSCSFLCFYSILYLTYSFMRYTSHFVIVERCCSWSIVFQRFPVVSFDSTLETPTRLICLKKWPTSSTYLN